MPALDTFSFGDLMELRGRIRNLYVEGEPDSFEAAARAMVGLLRNEFIQADGRSACALVRIYKTVRYAELTERLRRFALAIEPDAEDIPELRCLTLISTAGDEPEWNDRRASVGHQAIPLSSEQAVAHAPMVSQLIRQLGLEVAHVLRPDPALLMDMKDRAQGVFYVPHARGSAFIPAQKEFVIRHGIASVIGFGGMLATGDLLAAILFSRVAISPEVADQFKVVGLNFKLALLPWLRKPLFESD